MTNATSSRDRILGRVSRALADRDRLPHPGRLLTPEHADPRSVFAERFARAGGEVVAVEPGRDPGKWLANFLNGLGLPTRSVAPAPDLPANLRPRLPVAAPERAGAGVVLAWGAVAETGSLILASTGSRATQILPPVLIVWVPSDRVFGRLEDALLAARGEPSDRAGSGESAGGQPELAATLALHSGPSKSADIGRTVVTGVHGPGRCIAVFS